MYKTLTVFVLLTSFVFAQNQISTVYHVPFASKGNSISLEILNSSSADYNQVKVSSVNTPAWLTIESGVNTIDKLATGKVDFVDFYFAVNKNAPINEKHQLKFKVENSTGESWIKEINFIVVAPKSFILDSNFPNPFNPVTDIAFQLPDQGNIKITIYNVLGQKVELLFNDTMELGYQKVQWNASGFTSGIYIYEVMLKSKDGRLDVKRGRMLLVK